MTQKKALFLSASFISIFQLFFGTLAFGQTSEITGRISDPNGASVPGVNVVVTNSATGIKHETKTTDDGYYTVTSLEPASYSISINAQGYKPVVQPGIQLHVEQVLRLDFTLEVGAVTETVTVTTAPPLLETETSSVGQLVSSREVVEMPLLGRDAYALGELVPGVRGSVGMNQLPVDVITTSSISINGAAATSNDFLLDGAPNSAPSYNQPILYPIADSVQEFRVQTSNYSAQYGRSTGGIYDVVTKGGTNDVHLSAYEFYRSSAMNSNNWFLKSVGQPGPSVSFNQFGGVVGGPVVFPHYNGHNKTFFLFGTEYVRFNQGNTFTATVPTLDKLSGDISADGGSIYNPFSTTDTGGVYARSAFTGNVIPQGLLNPVAVTMASYLPAPQTTSATNNYIVPSVINIHSNEITARIDQVFTERTSMFARFSYDNTPEIRPNPYTAVKQGIGGPAFGPQVFNRYNAVIEGDHQFSGTMLASIRGSAARLENHRTPASLGFNIANLGFPSTVASEVGAPAAFPAIAIAGYSVSSSVANTASPTDVLGETGLIQGYMSTYSIGANLTKSARAHNLSAGTDLRLMQANILQTADNSNSFAFTSGFTQGPNPASPASNSGDALASFLLGVPAPSPAASSVNPSPALAIQTKYSAIYIQDDWKATKALTLNLGLRYDYETPYTERHNRLTNFDPNDTVPLTGVQGLKGALSFPGVDGHNRYDSIAYADHIAPRIGFAWHVFSRTVLHGGGGVFYDALFGPAGEAPPSYGISGFTAATNMLSTLDGYTPNTDLSSPYDNTLSNPYPNGLATPTGSSLGAATLLGQAVTASDRNLKAVSATQWSFGLQQQLSGSWVIDVSYVGNQGFHEPTNLSLDQLPDSDLALGTALSTKVTNPFYGEANTTGLLASPTITRGQVDRPYPQFNGVTSANATWSQSRYNALEINLQRKFSKGVSFQSSYAWSKFIDQNGTSGTFFGETLGGGAIQDYNNLKAETSTSSLDQTHHIVSDVMYQLPFYQNQGGLMGRIAGGWEISAITTFASGDPLGFTMAT